MDLLAYTQRRWQWMRADHRRTAISTLTRKWKQNNFFFLQLRLSAIRRIEILRTWIIRSMSLKKSQARTFCTFVGIQNFHSYVTLRHLFIENIFGSKTREKLKREHQFHRSFNTKRTRWTAIQQLGIASRSFMRHSHKSKTFRFFFWFLWMLKF